MLTKVQWSFLCGGLLGDLGLQFMGTHWRIRSGTQTDKEWLFKQYEYLKNFVKTPPKDDKEGRWYFNTVTIHDLVHIGSLWYPKANVNTVRSAGWWAGGPPVGIKVIPTQFVEDNFNELSLAVLFMGDGSKRDSGYVLCVDNLSEKEIDWLISFLDRKYSIKCNKWWKDGNPRIYVVAASRVKFTELVLPYIVESQKRKLFLDSEGNPY